MERSRRRVLLIAAPLAACLAGSAAALVVDNGLAPPNPANVITDGDVGFREVVSVQDAGCTGVAVCSGTPTRVQLSTLSQDVRLRVHHSSSALLDAAVAEDVIAYGTTEVELAAGTVQMGIDLEDQSTLLLPGGFVYDSIDAFGSSHVEQTGGYADLVFLHDSASISVSGGNIDYGLQLQGSSTGWVTGGAHGNPFMPIRVDDESEIRIQGGVLWVSLHAFGAGVIYVEGTEFQVDGAPVSYGPLSAASGILTGTLADGESLFVPFERFDDGAIVLLPEPSAPLMLAAGVALLILLRRDQRV